MRSLTKSVACCCMIWIHAWLHCRTGRSGGSGSAGSGGSRSWISISSWISSFRIVWISSESLSELAADHLTAWIIYLLMNLSEKSCWCDDLTLHIRLPPLESLFLFFYANAPPPPRPHPKKKKEKKPLSLNCIHIAREVSLFQSFLYNLVRGTTMDV